MSKIPVNTILLDFDEVVFDLRRFSGDLRSLFVECGIPRGFLESYYSRKNPRMDHTMSKTFYLLSNLKTLLDVDVDIDNLQMIVGEFLDTASTYVFDDVWGFLEKYSDKNIHILTYGCPHFQDLKIKHSRIFSVINGYVIKTTSKKSQALRNSGIDLRGSIFIDDRVKYIDDVKKSFPVIDTFWMERPTCPRRDEASGNCDFSVSSLKEISNIIC
ncbi:hypothetical protein ACFL16_02835 [Patescibacteria group bacterium]